MAGSVEGHPSLICPSSSPGRDTPREARLVERDPVIHSYHQRALRFIMDGRAKPGHDESN
jgi:hypothetical protein